MAIVSAQDQPRDTLQRCWRSAAGECPYRNVLFRAVGSLFCSHRPTNEKHFQAADFPLRSDGPELLIRNHDTAIPLEKLHSASLLHGRRRGTGMVERPRTTLATTGSHRRANSPIEQSLPIPRQRTAIKDHEEAYADFYEAIDAIHSVAVYVSWQSVSS